MNRRRAFAVVVTYTLLALALASLLTVAWTWTAIAYIVAAASVAFVVVFVVTWLRTGRDLDNAIAELNAGIDVDRHCSTHGHAFCHPELHGGHRLWRCENCGQEVESEPGWVDGRSAS